MKSVRLQEIDYQEFKNLLREVVRDELQELKETINGSDKEVMRIEDACRYLKVSASTIYRLVKRGKLTLLKKDGERISYLYSKEVKAFKTQ